MAKTISQRISLEGSEDIRRRLEELGKAGEQAFKQIQTAAQQPIADPAQLERTKRAVDDLVVSAQRLGQQFQPLTSNVIQFGTAGTQATQQVTAGLNQTETAAQKTGATIARTGQQAETAGASAGNALLSAATKFGLAAAAIGAGITAAAAALVKGTVDTATQVTEQADKVKLSVAQWQQLRSVQAGSAAQQENLAGSLARMSNLIDSAHGGVQRLSGSLRQFSVETAGGMVTISAFGNRMRRVRGEANLAATELARFNISTEMIAKGDKMAILQRIAENISLIENETERARMGQRAFGAEWEKTIATLLKSKKPIDETGKSLSELGKLHRQLAPADVEKANKLKDAWDDMGAALTAIKDRVGSMFLDPAITKATWMTNLIDGAHELLQTWMRLGEQARQAFLGDLGTTPAETAFKILIALGNQLAGIWNDVLVPAGQQLLNIISQVAGSLGGVSAAQVAAGFIVAAAAVTAFAVALKGISFLLTPISLLISLFTGFGPILLALAAMAAVFWEQLAAGAQTALALIPEEIAQIQKAFQALFRGDITTFWNEFSAAAKSAFDKIIQAILATDSVFADFIRAFTGEQIKTPWVQELLDAFRQIGAELPRTIGVIILAFLALRRAAVGAAAIINRLFGTKLTGTDVAVLAFLGSLTGLFTALAPVVAIVAGAFVILSNGLSIIVSVFGLAGAAAGAFIGALRGVAAAIAGAVAAFGALPVVIGVAIAAAAALGIALIALNWEAVKAGAIAAWNAVTSLIGNAAAAVGQFVATVATITWEALKTGATTAWNVVTTAIGTAITAVGQFSSSLATIAWSTLTGAATTAWNTVTGAIGTAVTAVANFISRLLLPTAPSPEAAAAWGRVTNAVNNAQAAVTNFAIAQQVINWELVAGVGGAAWQNVSAAIQESLAAVLDFINVLPNVQMNEDTINAIVEAWGMISEAIQGAASVVDQFANTINNIPWDQVQAQGVGAWDAITRAIERAIAALQRYIALLAAVGGRGPGGGGGAGGGGGGERYGGLIGGRGTGTSDSNLVWVSRGEHIMPARAVRQPGVLAFLEMLRRSGGNLRGALDDMGRFASGGLVASPIPALAAGGLNGGMSNVTIQFPGLPPISGLRASSDVVKELRNAAVLAQVRSGGRKPSRYT